MIWLINNDKLVRGKFLGLLSLPAVENFGGYEIFKVLMINENLDFIFRSFKIMVLFFKSFNYYSELLIVDIIIYFHRCKFLGIKGDGVEFFIRVLLGEDYL